jgi:hypothetical protein
MDPTKGSILFFSGSGLSNYGQSTLVKKSENVIANVGESDGEFYAELISRGESEQGATNMQQVLAGLIAFAKLQSDPGDKSVSPLLDAIQIKTDGPELKATLRIPADRAGDIAAKFQKDFATAFGRASLPVGTEPEKKAQEVKSEKQPDSK